MNDNNDISYSDPTGKTNTGSSTPLTDRDLGWVYDDTTGLYVNLFTGAHSSDYATPAVDTTDNTPRGTVTGVPYVEDASTNYQPVWNYDPDLGAWTDYNTGDISYSNPKVSSAPTTTAGNTTTGNTTTGGTSTGNTQSNLVYDDMTGMYINPLTGEYSYKAGGLMSLMRRK